MPTLISGDFISYLNYFFNIFYGLYRFIPAESEAVDLIFKLFILCINCFLQYLIVVIFSYEYIPGRDLTGPFGWQNSSKNQISRPTFY